MYPFIQEILFDLQIVYPETQTAIKIYIARRERRIIEIVELATRTKKVYTKSHKCLEWPISSLLFVIGYII